LGLENLKSAFSNIENFNQSDVAQMGSRHSIQTHPQEVNYVDEPNDKAVGFTANRVELSPSLFTGVGGDSPNMTFTNNSSYGEGQSVGWDSPMVNLYDTLTLYSDYPNNSGNYSIYETATDTKFYSGVSWTYGSQLFIGDSYSFDNGLPDVGATEWTIPTDFTYQNSEYGLNAIDTSFPGPVDFMKGENSYYNTLNPVVPGFTLSGRSPNTEFNIGGYTFADGTVGNSKYIGVNTGTHTNIPIHPYGNQSSYSTGATSKLDSSWTYTNEIPSNSTGGDIEWTPPDGFTHQDSIHTTNAIEQTFGTPVDFFDGKSLHPDSTVNASEFKISGFDKDYDPKLFGGWAVDTPYGDSKLLSMWENTETTPLGDVKTSLYTGYTGEYTFGEQGEILNQSIINFPGPIGNFQLNKQNVSFPGGFSSDNEVGETELNRTTTYHDYYGNSGYNFTINSETQNPTNNFFKDKIKIENGERNIESTKGSEKGGQISPQFSKLYSDGQSAGDKKYVGRTFDGSDIDAKERFNLKSDLWNTGDRVGQNNTFSLFNLSTLGLGKSLVDEWGNANEPYVQFWNDEVMGNNRFFPTNALQRDAVRISKFLSSPAGTKFVENQEIMGTFQLYKPFYDPGSTLLSVMAPKSGLGVPLATPSRDMGVTGLLVDLITPTKYTEWLDTRAGDGGFQEIGAAVQSLGATAFNAAKSYAEQDLAHQPMAMSGVDVITGAAKGLASLAGVKFPEGAAGISKGIGPKSGVNSKNNMQVSMGTTSPLGNIGKGDVMTLMPIKDFSPVSEDMKIKTQTSSGVFTKEVEMESSKEGMPFYFRDLRDNRQIYFRAYLSGISDTVSPNWTSQNYIGRSEPIYTYTNSERELAFNLTLFAQTKDELNMIYTKMNRLTSLCYPEYRKEETVKYTTTDSTGTNNTESTLKAGAIGEKLRMKAPLTKFRMGELFGGRGKSFEMTGFIKSLSYNFPDNSPWEIQAGYRVPKYVTVDIGYQVIHSESPSLDFSKHIKTPQSFYGINKNDLTTDQLNEAMKGG